MSESFQKCNTCTSYSCSWNQLEVLLSQDLPVMWFYILKRWNRRHRTGQVYLGLEITLSYREVWDSIPKFPLWRFSWRNVNWWQSNVSDSWVTVFSLCFLLRRYCQEKYSSAWGGGGGGEDRGAKLLQSSTFFFFFFLHPDKSMASSECFLSLVSYSVKNTQVWLICYPRYCAADASGAGFIVLCSKRLFLRFMSY